MATSHASSWGTSRPVDARAPAPPQVAHPRLFHLSRTWRTRWLGARPPSWCHSGTDSSGRYVGARVVLAVVLGCCCCCCEPPDGDTMVSHFDGSPPLETESVCPRVWECPDQCWRCKQTHAASVIGSTAEWATGVPPWRRCLHAAGSCCQSISRLPRCLSDAKKRNSSTSAKCVVQLRLSQLSRLLSRSPQLIFSAAHTAPGLSEFHRVFTRSCR